MTGVQTCALPIYVLASIGNHVSVVSSKSIKCTRDCKYRAGLPLIFVDDLVDLVDY